MNPSIPGGLAVLAALAPRTPAQSVPNDRCVDAIVLNLGLIEYGTVGATPDGSSSCASAANSPDVWYLLVPQSSGTAIITACRYQSALDPVLSVHSACPGDVSNEIVCDDEGGTTPGCQPGSARVQFAATAGQPYWVRLAGANGSIGETVIHVGGVTLPHAVNDTPETALDIATGSHNGMMGTVPTQLPYCVGTFGSFYHFTPSVSGSVTASTCSVGWSDTTMSVFDGSTMLGCCDCCCSGYQSYVTWNATAGREYTIRIGDFWGPYEGPVIFTLTGPARASEACATAAIQPLGTRLIELGRNASSGSSSCDTAPDTAWYGRVVANCDGILRVSTCGTNDLMAVDTGPDTRLSLHSGCPADASTELACSNDAPACGSQSGAALDAEISWPVTIGQSFVVRLTRDPRSSRTLPVRLTVSCETVEVVCPGDGSGTPCPCGNSGTAQHGCANSGNTLGSQLSRSGNASVSADTVTLHAAGTTPSGTGLYFQGTTAIGSGNPFGDGLRCAGGTIVRLAFRTSAGGSSSFGATDGTGASVSRAGLVPPSGGTRVYQLWYRDAQSYCTASTFNFSNGLRFTWVP